MIERALAEPRRGHAVSIAVARNKGELSLRLLRMFEAVAVHRSISGAAKTLALSQPGVSKALRELEGRIGLPLVERNAGGDVDFKGVRLTGHGLAFLDLARDILALERKALRELGVRRSWQEHSLVVGIPPHIGGHWLAASLGSLASEHPELQLRVEIQSAPQLVQALIDRRVDLAVLDGSAGDARIRETLWREDPLRLVTHPARMAADRQHGPADLEQEVWLMPAADSDLGRAVRQSLDELGLAPGRCHHFGSVEYLAQAVAEDIGVALLPDSLAGSRHYRTQLKRVPCRQTPSMQRSLFAAQLRTSDKSSLAALLLKAPRR